MRQCTEIKYTLDGRRQIYFCELLRYEPGFGMLRYVIDREYDVAGHKLLPGDVTYALYWEDRPYTLYVWDLGRIKERLYYFNIADSVSLKPEEFSWRDLTVDILIDAQGRITILDEHELPRDLAPELRISIKEATDRVMEQHQAIVREAEELIARFR